LPGFRTVEVTQPELVIGRHSEADLQLLEPDVSRFHCRLYHAGQQWMVEDLASLNGTLVNGVRVRCRRLDHDDVLSVGGFHFRIDLGSPDRDCAPLSPGHPPAADETDPPSRSHYILSSIAALLPPDADAPRAAS
jgi:pSer/pThr/pTyr-binding forkhead associated (FHA) protein